MSQVAKIKKTLAAVADKSRVANYQRFFKTGKGEYGEGDIFIGVSVPQQRKVALQFLDSSFADLQKLLGSEIHEHRFTALEILTAQYERTTDQKMHKEIYDFYISNTKYINNWDLVDTSAGYIVGAYLLTHSHQPLYKLARSTNLWERRIAIVATSYFINNNQLDDTFQLAEILMADTHDLIHKAVGWMLREAGKRDQERLIRFIEQHYRDMPRTMLRYAIERIPETKRKQLLALC